MSMLIVCPECDAKIRAPANVLGRSVRCPKCGANFTAASDAGPPPDLEPEPPPPPPEPEPDPFPISQPAPARARVDVQAPPQALGRIEPARRSAPLPEEEEAWEEMPTSPPAASFGQPPNPVVDLLLFRTMVSPIIIQVVFWLGVAGFILAGAFNIITAIGILIDGRMPALLGLFSGFLGMLTMLVGPLVWRVYCELMILMFRIYDVLREVHASSEKIRKQR